MNLYIMRHGIAFDHSEWGGSEFDRPLTTEGMERTAELMAALQKKNCNLRGDHLVEPAHPSATDCGNRRKISEPSTEDRRLPAMRCGPARLDEICQNRSAASALHDSGTRAGLRLDHGRIDRR